MKRLSISFFSCIHPLQAKVFAWHSAKSILHWSQTWSEMLNKKWGLKEKNSFDDLNVQVNSIWSLLCLYIIEIIDFLQQWDINIFNYSATMLRWYRQHAHVSSLSIETAHISRYLYIDFEYNLWMKQSVVASFRGNLWSWGNNFV